MIFGSLLLAFGGALAAAITLLDDPARGLVSGALPVAFGLTIWAITNGASYRLRHPDSLPEDRAPEADSAPASRHTEGDPFSEPQPPMSPAELAVKAAATGKKKPSRSRRKKPDAA